MCVPRQVYGGQRQLAGVGSFFLPCKFWRLKPGHQAWRQAPFLTKPSCQPWFSSIGSHPLSLRETDTETLKAVWQQDCSSALLLIDFWSPKEIGVESPRSSKRDSVMSFWTNVLFLSFTLCKSHTKMSCLGTLPPFLWTRRSILTTYGRKGF